MKQLLFASLLLCFVASICSAQTTTVTGTVKDVNGVAYAGASLKAQLVLAGVNVTGQPTVTVSSQAQCRSAGMGNAPCQVPFSGTMGPITLDPTGSFTLNLQDNGLVTPASTQWLFSVTTTGAPPPLGTGPQACSATLTITGASQSISASFSACPALSTGGGSANNGIGGAGVTGDSLTTVYDATAYGVVPNNGQACMDGNTTSGSPTVTTLGSCTFHCPGSVYPCSTNTPSPTNDVGKQIFVTNMCSLTSCGPYLFDASVNFLGAAQTSLVTILSIQSATSLTASANAAATCSAKAGGANVCTVVIVVDETSHINAMLTAGYLNSTPGCPRFQFPQGLFGFSAQLGTTQGSLSQCAINGGTKGHIQQLAEVGPAFVGVGQAATILVPLPNWNFAAWTTGSAIVSNSNGLAFIDIGISGFGQSFTGAGVTTGGGTVLLATPYTNNFMFTGWANHVNSLAGVSLGGWGTISNSFIQAVGSTLGTVAVTSQNSTIINSSIAGFQVLLVSGAPFTSNGNTYWGPQNTLPAIEVQSGGLMISAADTIQTINPPAQAHTPVIQVDSGGTLYSTNFTNALGGSSFDGLKINAGGTAFVFGWRDTATPTNSLINAGTFTDEGANKFNGPVSGAGSFFGSYSITGTQITAAKLVLSAGWGASAAWTALGGNTQYIQGTITNTGAGQAANPTITYTFPTPFYSAPVCSAYQVGGTQAILAATEFLTPSAVTATGATFTYNGTPTVNLTEVVQILCQNP